MTKRVDEAPIAAIAKGAAAGAQAVGRALGSKAAGATTANAINKLSQGVTVGKNVLGAVAPYAEIIGEILADPRYRALFMKLVNTIKADKARLQARQPAQAQPQESLEMENPDRNTDAVDTVTLDIPLMIRMLEFAKEDAADDMALHDATERLIALSKDAGVLTMDQYDAIVAGSDANSGEPEPGAPEPVAESLAYGYSQPGAEPDCNLSYSASKKVGDSTVNVSIQSTDMEELHRLIKLAGLENLDRAPEPEATVVAQSSPCMPGAELEFKLERAMSVPVQEGSDSTTISFAKDRGVWDEFAMDIQRVARQLGIVCMDASTDTMMKIMFNTPRERDAVMGYLDKSDYIEEFEYPSDEELTGRSVREAFEDDGRMSWSDWKRKAIQQGAVKFVDSDNKTVAYDSAGDKVSEIVWSNKPQARESKDLSYSTDAKLIAESLKHKMQKAIK